ncbi:hypothetical protein A2U01_0102405, partial [Trifolium medium]|nr:hypothetical protein [Trifolium medium]
MNVQFCPYLNNAKVVDMVDIFGCWNWEEMA